MGSVLMGWGGWMPKRRAKRRRIGIDPFLTLALMLALLLVLKGLGVLELLLGIDPNGAISFSDIFSGISIASLIGYLWRSIGKLEARIERLESRVNNIAERLARLEGILESRNHKRS